MIAARAAAGFPVTGRRAGRHTRDLGGSVIKGTCRLMGGSFGPICYDKGDGGCRDAPEVMA